MSCSRRAFNRNGDPIVIATTSSLGVPAGTVFRMLGDCINTVVAGDEKVIGWTGPSGRPPTPRERAEARPPYESTSRRQREAQAVGDDELDDRAAIEFARREQERTPTCLLAPPLAA